MATRIWGGADRRRPLRVLGALLGILLTAPFSVLATWLLLPLWSWVEAAAGIEAVGHSGPAEWCYAAAFGAFAAITALWLILRRRSG